MAGIIAPVAGLYAWDNCGDDFRFLFAGGTSLKLTMNFGTDNNFNKEGNLNYIAPLINVTGIRFIK